MSNTYQKISYRTQPDLVPSLTRSQVGVTVPERVVLSMTEIAGAAKEGPLAVVTGLQVLAENVRHVSQNEDKKVALWTRGAATEVQQNWGHPQVLPRSR